MSRTTIVAALVALVAATLLSSSEGAQARPQATTGLCGTRGAPPQTYTHVIWIWMENHSYDSIIGPPGSKAAASSPYINGTLVPSCGLATNYHGVSHPSLPNYIAATSGSTQGLARNCPAAKCPQNVPSIFGQVSTWREYAESMPSNCAKTGSGNYAPEHNPAIYYQPIAAACATSDVPLGTTSSGNLASDLSAGTLPAFAFVNPDECNSTETCTRQTGDAWLQAWVAAITASATYRAGGTALFISWDEGRGGVKGENCAANPTDQSCHVATIVVSPYTSPGTRSSAAFDHYSLLRTTEELLGITSYLGSAASAPSMRSAFHL